MADSPLATRALPIRHSAARVSRIFEVTFDPPNYRPPRHPDPVTLDLEDSDFARRLDRASVALGTAYAIQDRCGAIPLTAHERNKLAINRGRIAERRTTYVDGLRAHADKLVDQVACSHCMAREDCLLIRGRA